MKIFGKRTSTKSPVSKQVTEPNVVKGKVASYFSPNFCPASFSEKNKGKDNEVDKVSAKLILEEILSKDPSTLNSKERRILRRYEERSGGEKKIIVEDDSKVNAAEKEADVCGGGSNTLEEVTEVEHNTQNNEIVNVEEKEEMCALESSNIKKNSPLQKPMQPETEETKQVLVQNNASAESLIDQMKDLNSKERRKLLRQLASSSSKDLLAVAEKEAHSIAEKNRLVEKAKHQDEKSNEGKLKEEEEIKGEIPKSKKRKLKDLSHLDPAERLRRETQRKMQQEAAERRASGEQDLTRHPLNSERRRANRRKPGRAGTIALLKREAKENQQRMKNFNAGGYNIRHQKA